MMRSTVEFEERPAQVVAWVPCEFTSRDMEDRANRLRSWALIVGATISGPAFVTLRGAEGARLCLPLAEWHPAHPETGVTIEREDAGAFARVADAPVADAHDIAQALLADLGGPCSARGDAEFHPSSKGSLTGDLLIPVRAEAVSPRLAVAV